MQPQPGLSCWPLSKSTGAAGIAARLLIQTGNQSHVCFSHLWTGLRREVKASLLFCPLQVENHGPLTRCEVATTWECWTECLIQDMFSVYRAPYQCTGQWLGCEACRSHVQYTRSSELVNSAERKVNSQSVETIPNKTVVQFVGSNARGKETGSFTRKSSSGNADMKAGSIAWRKSKPWVAHLQTKRWQSNQCFPKLSASVSFIFSVTTSKNRKWDRRNEWRKDTEERKAKVRKGKLWHLSYSSKKKFQSVHIKLTSTFKKMWCFVALALMIQLLFGYLW